MNPSRCSSIVLLVFASLVACFPQASPGQIREETKQQVEQRLARLTPEEIEQQLREMGITRDEAVQRASEIGISLDEYLSRARAGTGTEEPEQLPFFQTDPRTSAGTGFQSDPRLKSMSPRTLRRIDSLKAALSKANGPKRVHVPGFVGRRGVDSTLQPFGIEIFQGSGSAFMPSAASPAPPSYPLGPGDELAVSVWGETRLNYSLTVNRDGNLVVPEVGPVGASGLTLAQFREKLLQRMSAIYSSLRGGANARAYLDVSLGQLKSIQVFVLGEVVRPGGYQLPSMATPLTAMYMAGGPSVDGSMRDIRVVRRGDSVATIDLYSYVLRGEGASGVTLRDGDIVFVKPAGKRAAVSGEVLRPAIYELATGETLGDLVAFSGGPRFSAYIDRVHIERIVPFDHRKSFARDIQDFDVRFNSVAELRRSSFEIENGDILTIMQIGNTLANRVMISGNVNKPGPFEFKEGMRVRDLVLDADSLRRDTFGERASLFRVLPNLKTEIHSFNLRLAIEGDETSNLPLMNEDSVVVYHESRFFPHDSVTILGSVAKPGMYTLNVGMTLGDLIMVAGGLKEDASARGWEVSRMDTAELGVYSRVFKIDVAPEYWNRAPGAAFSLLPHDLVFVPPDPRFVTQRIVRLSGYVMFPGIYALRYEGERLSELFERAGGLRQGAYLEGSRLIRSTNNAGLLPLDFRKALEDRESRDNIVLYPGDSIHVAFSEDVVYVSGEVIVPSPVLYRKGALPAYYISQAGGFKEDADQGRTVTLLPGGKKWESSGFFLVPDPEVLPGSSIFVPKQVERDDKTLPLIRDLATILASLAALTVAVVQVTK